MKRTVIKIDENRCNGCGACVGGCHEGALQLIDGKAVMISDLYCDGLGACIGECPVDAITLEEREAEPYNETAVMERIAPKGEAVILAHLAHLAAHNETEWVHQGIAYIKEHGLKVDLSKIGLSGNADGDTGFGAGNDMNGDTGCCSGGAGDDLDAPEQKPAMAAVPEQKQAADKPLACGCPGSMAREIKRPFVAPAAVTAGGAAMTGGMAVAGGAASSGGTCAAGGNTSAQQGCASQYGVTQGSMPQGSAQQDGTLQGCAPQPSELRQFPVQLHLVNPQAGFLRGANLLLAADCTAFASGEFHSRFLRGKTLAIACPKLDSNTQVYVDKLVQMIDEAAIDTLTVLVMEVPCCGGLVRIAQTARAQARRNIPVKVIVLGIDGEVRSEEWV